MISDQMRKLFGYNNWAWQRVFASVEKLDLEAYHAPRPVFGGSIHGVLVHAMSAEYVWLMRCKGESPSAMLDPKDYADFTAVVTDWRRIIHNWANEVQWLTDERCFEPIHYETTRGQKRTLPLVDILQHVINHATEHRSQLTPILYHLDVPTEPLDYMLYCLQR